MAPAPLSRRELPPHRSPRLQDALWLLAARLTHPPFVGSHLRLTKHRNGGCRGRLRRYLESLRERRVAPQLTPLGIQRRRRPQPPPFLFSTSSRALEALTK